MRSNKNLHLIRIRYFRARASRDERRLRITFLLISYRCEHNVDLSEASEANEECTKTATVLWSLMAELELNREPLPELLQMIAANNFNDQVLYDK